MDVVATPVPGGAVHKFTGAPTVFRIPNEPQGVPITLEPFYQVHGASPYAVYWDGYDVRTNGVRTNPSGPSRRDREHSTNGPSTP